MNEHASRPPAVRPPASLGATLATAAAACAIIVAQTSAQAPTPTPNPAAAPAPAAPAKLPAQGPTWQELPRATARPFPVTVDPPSLDLGDVAPGGTTSGTFTLTNTGTEPLIIESALSPCWCTVADLKETAIAPAASLSIPVTFTAPPYITNERRELIMKFKGFSRPFIASVAAKVHYGIRPVVQFDPPDQRRIGTITLESADGSLFLVRSVDGRPPEFLDGFDPNQREIRSRYEVRWDLSAYPMGNLPEWVLVETDHASSPVIDLAVEDIETEGVRQPPPPWEVEGRRIMLGAIEPGGSRLVTVGVTGPFGDADAFEMLEDLRAESEGPWPVRPQVLGVRRAKDKLELKLRFDALPTGSASAAPAERAAGSPEGATDGTALVNMPLLITLNGNTRIVPVFGRVQHSRD